MRAVDFQELLDTQPFKPFVVHTSTGERFTIPHPDMIMIGRSSVTIGLPTDNSPRVYERTARISLLHVVKLDHTNSAQSPED